MGQKKVSVKDRAEKKKRMVSIELKKEIIQTHDQGVRVVDLVKQYERNTSTICSILTQKESLQAMTPAKGVTQQTSIREDMEKLLMDGVVDGEAARRRYRDGPEGPKPCRSSTCQQDAHVVHQVKEPSDFWLSAHLTRSTGGAQASTKALQLLP